MTISALPIGEMLVRRHSWGLFAVAATLAAFALATGAAPGPMADVVGLAIVLYMFAVSYLTAVCAFGFDTDVAGAGSCFPARMFTLPVGTAALAGWPMLFGVAALAGLWLASAELLFRPWGYKAPLLWPALLAAAQVVWVQALLWWPFGLPWARVAVGVFVVHAPAAGTIAAFQMDFSPREVVYYLNGCLAVGAVAAYAGVARSRRGVVPRWDWLTRAGRRAARSRPGFASPGRAQSWYEWRRHGRSLPLLTAGVMPVMLLPFFVGEHTPASLVRDFVLVLAVPVFFAGTTGTVIGKHNPWVRDFYGVPSFTATRPVTTAALVAAILQSATRATLTAWAIAAAMIAATVFLSGADEALGVLLRRWLDAKPAGEVAAVLVAGALLLLIVTWKRLAENLLIGLTGREWVIKGSLFGGLFVGFSALVFVLWLLASPQHQQTARDLLPWLLGVAVGLKFAAGAAVARGLVRKRLVPVRTLAALAAAWFAVFAGLTGLLAWAVPEDVAGPLVVAGVVVLLLPLVRVSMMPLALDWSRHR
jgi:hypothetical protein